ncbi:MAG: DNA-3-methyladenine glycosylase, partial [Bacteroidota bacterium]
MKLKKDFYLREDVVLIARELLGKYLFTKFNDNITGGIITETEAYAGVIDKASHAFGGKRTNRTEIMFATGGVAYVYLCYGIHHLFNVVTNAKEIPHAVLIRSIHPTHGIDVMLKRRKKKSVDKTLTKGPGSVALALGIEVSQTGLNLSGNKIWIEDKKYIATDSQIEITKRIGVEYSGEAAHYPYRFVLKNLKIG